MTLVPLYEEMLQVNDYNGSVLAGGIVTVYHLGRTQIADIYSDINGTHPLANPFRLDNLGMQEVYVSDAFNYEVVVHDAYGSELFSVEKYINATSTLAHADVAVAASDTVCVSSYKIGDTTVYQPYITGGVGKTYTGIYPIDVNNTANMISADSVPIGVQDPLYIVQDDAEAFIIGASGLMPESASSNFYPMTGNPSGFLTAHQDISQKLDSTAFSTVSGSFLTSLPAGTMNETGFGYEEGLITGYNNSAFSAGSDTDPAVFVPWSASGAFAASGDITGLASETELQNVSSTITGMIPSTAGLATESWVTSQGYLTAETDWTDTITAASANAYEQATAAIPTDYLTTADSANFYTTANESGFITGVDLTPYQTTAGMTAYQPTAEMTAYQTAGNYQSALEFGYMTI